MNYLKYSLGVLVLGGILWAGVTYPEVKNIVLGSAVNSTFNSAKVASVNITPSSSSATSTSILNTDASDRIVTDAFVTCQSVASVFAQDGLGVSGWLWVAATTSTAAPAVLPATAFAAMNVVVGTSTADAWAATTTYTSPFARRWATGTYMTFWQNATSSTATCQGGVHYLAT